MRRSLRIQSTAKPKSNLPWTIVFQRFSICQDCAAPFEIVASTLSVSSPARIAKLTASESAWTSPAGKNPDWFRQGGAIRPGQLLLWKPTLNLRNYEFTFQGEIERKALAWVFRATDGGNYYAVKIRTEEARAGGAAIERWVVARGEKSQPLRLPLPVRLRPRTPFQVSVRVRADHFVTLVDNQVVDSWRDGRHARGGVGFFADPGEEARLDWVRITDTSSLWERVRLWTLLLPPSW